MYSFHDGDSDDAWRRRSTSEDTGDDTPEPDYYGVLGIAPDASDEDIQRAFRRLAKLWHPDHFSHSSAEHRARADRRMRQLIAARDVLADPESRTQYDARRRRGTPYDEPQRAYPVHQPTPPYFGGGYSGTLQHASANPNGAGQFAGILALVLAIAIFGGALSGGLGSSAPALIVFGILAVLLGIAALLFMPESHLARGAQSWMESDPQPSPTHSGSAGSAAQAPRRETRQQPPGDAFQQLASDALADVPQEFQPWLRNVLIEIVDEPSDEMLRELDVREGCTLFGLYSGVPLPKRYGREVPTEIITIFKGPIQRHCEENPVCMREQVRRTVLHELAHHFGIDHADMPDWIR